VKVTAVRQRNNEECITSIGNFKVISISTAKLAHHRMMYGRVTTFNCERCRMEAIIFKALSGGTRGRGRGSYEHLWIA